MEAFYDKDSNVLVEQMPKNWSSMTGSLYRTVYKSLRKRPVSKQLNLIHNLTYIEGKDYQLENGIAVPVTFKTN